MFFDLTSDPHEDWNLFHTDLTNAWMLIPALRLIGEHEASVKQYPKHFNWRKFPRLYDEVGEDLGLVHETNKSCRSNNLLRGE